MATTIVMPQLGETVTEGTVAQWLKAVGDTVGKYEPFVEVSTDKVNAEVPSPVSGVIRELIVREGETVPTGAPIAIIDEVAARATAPPAVVPSSYGAPGAGPGVAAAPSANGERNGERNGVALVADHAGRRYSPAVRRLAREHHVDVAALRGTGAHGRVTANDVLAAAHEGPSAVAAAVLASGAAAPQPPAAKAPATPPAATTPPAGARPTYAAPVLGQTIPLTQARKIIAQRMVESKHVAPHAWTMVEVDVTHLWRFRTREKDRFLAERGAALTILPFFIHAAVQALRLHPLMNARYTEEGILVHREINVGIAIALESNLVVPVLRDADTLSITGLALAAGKIVDRARAGRLTADDLGGGTFTVNNTGANGSILSAPILNGGQAGIVTMEAIVKRPVVVEHDAIAIRSMMNVCLSLDHRVVDGAIANAFLVELKKRLQAMGGPGFTL